MRFKAGDKIIPRNPKRMDHYGILTVVSIDMRTNEYDLRYDKDETRGMKLPIRLTDEDFKRLTKLEMALK